jgi:hypothetical protein
VASEFLVRTAKAQRSASAAEERLFALAHLPKVVRAVRPAAKALRVLVVDSPTLHALAATLLQSSGDALSVTSEKATMFCAEERAFDIVLVAVSSSTLAAMVSAAHLRAIEWQKPVPGGPPSSRAPPAASSTWTASSRQCTQRCARLAVDPGCGACVSRPMAGAKVLPALVGRATRIR